VARGDPYLSPWVWDARDYLGRAIVVTVPFNDATRDILNGIVIHRDTGCLYVRIVWDDPSNPQKAKRSPVVPVGDTTLTAQQLRQATGFRTIEELMAVQVTAETE
jgi:hypothetical protein